MRNDPLDVSIVIPSYKRPDFLVAAIESALAQTKPAREIIVVDDGSEQETAAAVSPYQPRVTYIWQENGGEQAARNRGVEAATSTWVATLDDDDLYRPDYLEQVFRAIEGSPAQVIYTDHLKFGRGISSSISNFAATPEHYWDGIPRPKPESEETWTFVGRFPLERLLRFIPFYPSTMTMKRDYYLSLGGYDQSLLGIKCHDIDFLARALRHADLAVVWKILVEYRNHDNNDTKSDIDRVLGRWQTFEFIRRNRDLGQEFISALDSDLPGRRAQAFDLAFTARDLVTVSALAPQLGPRDWTIPRYIKRGFATLPKPVSMLALNALRAARHAVRL